MSPNFFVMKIIILVGSFNSGGKMYVFSVKDMHTPQSIIIIKLLILKNAIINNNNNIIILL